MFYMTYFMREVPKNHLKSILSWSHEKVKLVAIRTCRNDSDDRKLNMSNGAVV